MVSTFSKSSQDWAKTLSIHMHFCGFSQHYYTILYYTILYYNYCIIYTVYYTPVSFCISTLGLLKKTFFFCMFCMLVFFLINLSDSMQVSPWICSHWSLPVSSPVRPGHRLLRARASRARAGFVPSSPAASLVFARLKNRFWETSYLT